ncbi:hypothetical protein JCM8097_006627 [Rhodosporidiobolus ruineniae]
MPIPPLPLEIVGLIIDEVRLGLENDEERWSNCRNLALVCREWRSLGTAAYWHTVGLESPDEGLQVDRHLKRYPHLASLVRMLELRGEDGSRYSLPPPSGGPPDYGPSEGVYTVIRRCLSLRELACTAGAPAAEAFAAFPTSSASLLYDLYRLTSVSVLCLHIPFHLEPLDLNAPSDLTADFPPPPAVLLPLRHLEIVPHRRAWAHPTSFFTSHLLRATNPATLRALCISLFPTSADLVRQLSSFPDLRSLEFTLEDADEARHIFDDVLRLPLALDKLKSITVHAPDGPHDLRSPQTPTLCSFLDSIPLSSHRVVFLLYNHELDPAASDPPEVFPSMMDRLREAKQGVAFAVERVDATIVLGRGQCTYMKLIAGEHSGWYIW